MTIVILFGCVKPQEDLLIVTNTEDTEVTFKLNFEKSLKIMQPGEALTFDVSGWQHVQVGSYADSVYVDGIVEYP